MARTLQALVLTTLLALPLAGALAQDGLMAATPAEANSGAFPTAFAGVPTDAPTDDPFVRYLLGLGPIGALVYGAFLMGKGVKVNIVVNLSDEDRKLAERATEAVEQMGQRHAHG